MQVEAENLIARVAAAEGPLRRQASAGIEVSRRVEKAEFATAASSRATSERKLVRAEFAVELVSIPGSGTRNVTRGAGEPRRRAGRHAGAAGHRLADITEPLRTHRAQSVAGGSDYNKINTMRSTFEKRTEDLKAELMQERRERKFAECALRVARAERLHLQHELAKVRAMGWRKITPESNRSRADASA